MKEKIVLDFGKRKIPVEAEEIRGIRRGIGLMFSRREKAKILIFKFSKPTKLAIHSMFVFFPFIAAWIGSDGKVAEIKKVFPFTGSVSPQREFVSLVEIPMNTKNRNIVVGIEKFK